MPIVIIRTASGHMFAIRMWVPGTLRPVVVPHLFFTYQQAVDYAAAAYREYQLVDLPAALRDAMDLLAAARKQVGVHQPEYGSLLRAEDHLALQWAEFGIESEAEDDPYAALG